MKVVGRQIMMTAPLLGRVIEARREAEVDEMAEAEPHLEAARAEFNMLWHPIDSPLSLEEIEAMKASIDDMLATSIDPEKLEEIEDKIVNALYGSFKRWFKFKMELEKEQREIKV